MLLQAGMHRVVAVGHCAQLVLDLGWRVTALGRLFGFFLHDRLYLADGLRLGCGLWNGLRVGLRLIKGGLQVGTAVGAKMDAAGQLLAATVAEAGSFLVGHAGVGRVTVRRIGVVTNYELAVFIGAYRKALRTHDLTIVYHQFLLGHRHPFTALWTL